VPFAVALAFSRLAVLAAWGRRSNGERPLSRSRGTGAAHPADDRSVLFARVL